MHLLYTKCAVLGIKEMVKLLLLHQFQDAHCKSLSSLTGSEVFKCLG